MALTDFSGLTIGFPQTGIQFTKVTDTSADWASVANSTYFYDKADKLVYYKDANGVIQNTYRNLPSVQSLVSAATVTPTANDDLVVITAQAAALTLAAPTGTPVQGQALMIRIKDDGTAQTITWTSGTGGYRAIGVTLPTTTVISKTTYVGFIYNSTDSLWDAIGVTTEA
jgi:hypothetical protein